MKDRALMNLYNTASRQIEPLKPIKNGEVKLYTCGPTVYDYSHIGNLRSFVFDDTLRRTLQADGLNVRHVMNITDVGHLASDNDEGEDKLEKGAARENKSVWEVADYFIEAFLNDMKALNILEPNAYAGPHGVYARATDFIEAQIGLVKQLVDKGFAYQTEQAIYFDVNKLPDYGKLTGQKLSEKETAARAEVVTDSHKRHPQDFAVWFFTVGRFANHSMHWSSPWGEGFPGWHLECSAIIHATLGEPIDIHTGGVDHVGTHHTNEIAQTEAAYGVKLANYWMHNEHLLVDGRKMSKSKANYYTLKDITGRGYDPLALRLLFLQSHYRSQANFSWEALDGAQASLKSLQAWADSSKQTALPVMDDAAIRRLESEIKSVMSDDLSSAEALARINQFVDKSAPSEDLLREIDYILGLGLSRRSDVTAEQKVLVEERERARQAEDWSRADELRNALLKDGIEINDTPSGPLWRRV
jgi:cysteinyl-tRNA synthetase